MRFLQKLERTTRVDRDTFLIQASSNMKVLHVGCVDSGLLDDRLAARAFLHTRLGVVAKELWGLDTDADGVRRLRQMGFKNVYAGSAESPPSEIPHRYFDVIVAGEVIEHVRNAGRLLDSAARLLVRDGRVVITTPNALRFYNPLPAILGRELTHPDHVSWYSPHTLRRTVELSSFHVESLHVYAQRPQAKCSVEMGRLQRSTRNVANIVAPVVHAALVRFFPYLSDGLVVVGRLSSAGGENEISR